MKFGLKCSAFLVLLFVVLSAGHARAVSIGISPADVIFENVLKGGYAERTIAVSTSSETPVSFHVSATGYVSDWIEFGPSEGLEVSRGSMKRVTVIVRPPDNVANGVYTGSIVVGTEPQEAGGEGVGVGVTTGAAAGVSVTITGEEIKKAKVESISVKDTEEGNPVEFVISITNQGNVIVTPLIGIEVTEEGKTEVVKSAAHGETEILPTTMKTIRISMETGGMDIGEYEGDVEIFLDGESLAEQVLPFSVFERGTLSKMGILHKVWNEPWVNVGDLVRIDAYFENTGELVVAGKFKGEVYFGGSLTDVVESEELEVQVGKTVVMSAYFRPESPGKYVVRGHVVYGGKTTGIKESFINAGTGEGGLNPEEMNYIALLASVIVVILIIVVLLKRRLGGG